MSLVAFGFWLVLISVFVFTANLGIWIRLSPWLGGGIRDFSWRLFFAKVSVLFAVNSLFLAGLLDWEARDVLGTGRAPLEFPWLHMAMGEKHGRAIMAASNLIALITIPAVPVGLLLGAVGWRSADRRIRRVGMLGAVGNGLLLAFMCWQLAVFFLPRSGRASSRGTEQQTAADPSQTPDDPQPSGSRSRTSGEWPDWPDWRDAEAVRAFAKPYENRGYRVVVDHSLEVEQPITRPTIFFGRRIVLKSDAAADVTIVAQVGQVQGQIAGTLEFWGQWLHVEKGALVTEDILSLGAQVLQIEGTVQGSVRGTYGSLRMPEPARETTGNRNASD